MHASERYYIINRIGLKAVGLWPFQQSYLTQLQNVFFISTLVTFIVVQLLAFITNQYSTSLLLQILSFVFPIIIDMTKYCLFIIQANNLKQLLEQIQDDWNSLKDKFEISIIEKYAYNARLFTIILMAYCYFGLLFCGIFQCLPIILDVVLPLNESRPRHLFVITEYFINQDKYFYVILFHEALAYSVGTSALCCTSATIMICIMHACALFEIASCRIENAIKKSTLKIPRPRRDYFLYRSIIHAVTMHQRASKFAELLTSSFTTLFSILIILGVSSLSFNLFQFLQLITLTKNTNQMSMVAVLILVHFNYMFVANYGGQQLLNHSLKLFKATYNGLWYAAPLRTQKLLLFIMQKGAINIGLTCGGIFVVSLEGFATLTNAAVSYVTLIYSTR
ncbi:PREDICTED: uncharacterized protein LOC105559967 [Vollenhovia emeryi]|uniref:uncharacterized protein LOC105559967 n=1 Tax=Vollenhovia emeryi TaxID=411798 RepID=UPI0005F509FB|nr:PREDICTED: uncharacterized protein LOC105559967 [Vollenhovia emeryi]